MILKKQKVTIVEQTDFPPIYVPLDAYKLARAEIKANKRWGKVVKTKGEKGSTHR